MENPIKMDDLGENPLFSETSILPQGLLAASWKKLGSRELCSLTPDAVIGTQPSWQVKAFYIDLAPETAIHLSKWYLEVQDTGCNWLYVGLYPS